MEGIIHNHNQKSVIHKGLESMVLKSEKVKQPMGKAKWREKKN